MFIHEYVPYLDHYGIRLPEILDLVRVAIL